MNYSGKVANSSSASKQDASLDPHVETSVKEGISKGISQNSSEAKCADLRLLEEENRFTLLSNAISEGIDSGIDISFDPQQHLAGLKSKKKKIGGVVYKRCFGCRLTYGRLQVRR